MLMSPLKRKGVRMSCTDRLWREAARQVIAVGLIFATPFTTVAGDLALSSTSAPAPYSDAADSARASEAASSRGRHGTPAAPSEAVTWNAGPASRDAVLAVISGLGGHKIGHSENQTPQLPVAKDGVTAVQ